MIPRFLRLPAVLVGALALGVGVGATAPAAHASITPACAWQSLYLLNGWQSAQVNWNTGDPEYCVDGGIVYLSGSLKNPSNGGTEFAQLPPQALPTSNVDMLTYTYNGTTGPLIILSDGAMYATGSEADQYTSLAGISFPVAGTALTPLSPLRSGWQSAQGQYGTGDPSYVISNGIIHWTGSVTTTQTSGPYPNYFASVPAGTDSGRCLTATVYTYGGDVGKMPIWPPSTNPAYANRLMGVANFSSNDNSYASFTSLANVSYPVAGAANWQPLSLQDGWAGYSDVYCQSLPSAPSYYVQGHIAYLIGWLAQDSPGSSFIGTLPLPARPVHDLYLIAGPDGASLHISPNGNMYLFGATQDGVHLDAIAYQTSS